MNMTSDFASEVAK